MAEAEQTLRRVFTDREKALGPDHPLTISLAYDFAVVYHHEGKMMESQSVGGRILSTVAIEILCNDAFVEGKRVIWS